jgi:hypothetical protein
MGGFATLHQAIVLARYYINQAFFESRMLGLAWFGLNPLHFT